jgi:general secretion pathway protein A
MYEAHFGFTSKPFQLSPDPDFFFGSRGHKRAMAYLEYGLHQGEGFIVITGEVGAGKTMLARSLLRRIPKDSIHAVQIVSSQLDADDLLRSVAIGFGLEANNTTKSSLIAQLESQFMSIMSEGKRALLIVDEAQNLSPKAVEELRMLSNFQVENRSLLQSFLIGQPEFREVMQRPEMRQLKQRVTASYHLGPLDPAETKAYIEHRLGRVGWTTNPSFDMQAFAKIAQMTGGIPRRINALCDRLMLACFLGEKSSINASDVDEISTEIADELGTLQLDGRTTQMPPNWQSEALASQKSLPADNQTLQKLDQRLAVVEHTVNLIYANLRNTSGSAQFARREQ